jgi:hypothetical protein
MVYASQKANKEMKIAVFVYGARNWREVCIVLVYTPKNTRHVQMLECHKLKGTANEREWKRTVERERERERDT